MKEIKKIVSKQITNQKLNLAVAYRLIHLNYDVNFDPCDFQCEGLSAGQTDSWKGKSIFKSVRRIRAGSFLMVGIPPEMLAVAMGLGDICSIQFNELVVHFYPRDAAAQDAGGRLDILGGFPVSHVGVAAFAALATFHFFGTDIAHTISRQNILAGFLGADFFHKPGLDEWLQ